MLSNDEIEKVRREYTAPFYLKFRRDGLSLAPKIVELAHAASEAQVLFMLETEEWRSRKMGALFALARKAPSIHKAVLRSLETSQGTLTAPELSSAAIVLHGNEALPSLVMYESNAIARNLGGFDITAAAIHHLGGEPMAGDAEAGGESFGRLLRMGTFIHES
ncbi:hypothetical protein [Lacisediminihabitans sp. H27-G8]|uniref:hypothetical protein n=1 Tax=Lacisediminihabitans sp. H27-G8 TaxID=3111909 RepID=UPI0038FC2FFE